MAVARAYIRVSKFDLDEQDDKYSPSVQLETARKFAEEKGLVFDAEASFANRDLNVSAYSKGWRQRPGLMRHYEDARRGLFQVLCVHMWDRFARNHRQNQECKNAFRDLGVEVRSVHEDIDPNTTGGQIAEEIFSICSEDYSHKLSIRVTAAAKARAQKGRLHGGRLPMWLRWKDKEHTEIVVIDEQAGAIKRAIELRLGGHGWSQIARTLNDEGYRTVTGNLWQKSKLVCYLTPRTGWIDSMCGTYVFHREGRYKVDRKSGKRVKQGDPIAVPGLYPRIIDDETAQRLKDYQGAVAAKAAPIRYDWSQHRWAGRHSGRGTYLLSGVVVCSACGGRMAGHSRKDKTPGKERDRLSYYCHNAKLTTERVPHDKSIVDARILEDAVLRALSLPLYRAWLDHKNSKKKAAPAPKTRTVEHVQADIDRLMGIAAKGFINESDLERQYNALHAEREFILRASALPKESTLSVLESAPDELTRLEQRALIVRLVSRVEYPVFVDGIENTSKGRGIGTPKPCAKIILKEAEEGEETVFICPVYRREYTGPRMRLAQDADGSLYQLVYDGRIDPELVRYVPEKAVRDIMSDPNLPQSKTFGVTWRGRERFEIAELAAIE